MRLQTKLLLLLIPLIVIPLLTLGWSAYSMLVEDARNRMQEQMTTLLRQISIQTGFKLRTARANASLFASTNLLRRYLQEGEASPDSEALKNEVLEQLFSYQIAYPEYYEIRVLSVDGIELIRSALGKVRNLATDESATDHFIASSKQTGKTYTAFFRNPDNNEPALLVSKPLFFPVADPQQKETSLELHGYLLLTVDLGFLQAHAHRELIGDRGRVFFTDNEGMSDFSRSRSCSWAI